MASLKTAYNYVLEACNDPNTRYSQAHRNKSVIDGLTYYDCSSLINFAINSGGWDTPDYAPDSNSFTTVTMWDELVRLGFTKLSVDDSFTWKPGDIARQDGHTEMCYTGGVNGAAVFMGARSDEYADADQVAIDPYASPNYYECYRWPDSDMTDDEPEKKKSSLWVISAMLGNFWAESTVNPGIWQGLHESDSWDVLRVGYGLGQWTNTTTQYGTSWRLRDFHDWMINNGYAVDDLGGQIKYIDYEHEWLASSSDPLGYSSFDDFVNSNSTDLDDLTASWFYSWENPGDDTLPKRQGYAQTIFDYLSDHKDDNVSVISGNRYLSESEVLNNSVAFYQMWNIGSGGGEEPNPDERRHRFPVWLMIRKRRF